MKSVRVLVVEDDPGSRLGLAELLREEGYRVDDVATGREALARVRDVVPDFAVIDIHLPDHNGIELMRDLKRAVPNCECIIASGSSTLVTTGDGPPLLEDHSLAAQKAGALAYLTKPINIERLLLMLARVDGSEPDFA